MLDIKFVRENPDIVKRAAHNKNVKVDVDHLLRLDEERHRLQTTVEGLNQERNEAARGKEIERGKLIKESLGRIEDQLHTVDAQYTELMLKLPNIPSDDTPIGIDESGNRVVRKWGEPAKLKFEPKEHWQLGEELGVIDNQTAAEVSGSRFTYLKGDLALLQFALIQFVMKTLTSEETLSEIIKKNKLDVSAKPFVPVVPPVFIKQEVFQRMGRLETRDER